MNNVYSSPSSAREKGLSLAVELSNIQLFSVAIYSTTPNYPIVGIFFCGTDDMKWKGIFKNYFNKFKSLFSCISKMLAEYIKRQRLFSLTPSLMESPSYKKNCHKGIQNSYAFEVNIAVVFQSNNSVRKSRSTVEHRRGNSTPTKLQLWSTRIYWAWNILSLNSSAVLRSLC